MNEANEEPAGRRQRWIVPAVIAGIAAVGGGGYKVYSELTKPKEDISPEGIQTVVVPSERSSTATDIQFKLRIPAVYLDQNRYEKNNDWARPIHAVAFNLDLDGNLPTRKTPLEDPSVVFIYLSLVTWDALDKKLNPNNPNGGRPLFYERQYKDEPPPRPVTQKYGLAYWSVSQLPYVIQWPPNEYLFRQAPDYDLYIECIAFNFGQNRGCIMRTIGARGGGVVANGQAALERTVHFHHSRLSEWHSIDAQVDAFLAGKITIVPWGK